MPLFTGVNLKKYRSGINLFVLFLTFAAVSCSIRQKHVSRIEGTEIGITASLADDAEIENFIKPYRDHINADLSAVLSYAPESIDKSGQWQTPMGNLFGDAAMKMGNPVFRKRENKEIDMVMLNAGGVRSIIPKGDVMAKTAFEIMPFENSMVVVALNGGQIMEMINYIIAEKKPHPVSGLSFTMGKDGVAKDILIAGKAFDAAKIYYVGTNDYLYNGGDNMLFFKKGSAKYDLDYKLRNILIDYFKETDTVPLIRDVRIRIEK